MRYFIDTEFNEDASGVTLLSLALRSEDGRELYLVDNQVDRDRCCEWVRANVVPHLFALPAHYVGPSSSFAPIIEEFFAGDPSVEVWGFFSAYDWYLFCRLWGALINLPKGVRRYCGDIAQMRDAYSPGQRLKDVVPVQEPHHNALADARWNAAAYAWLERTGGAR